MADWLQQQWIAFTLWHILLMPLSWLFGVVAAFRKWLYKINWLKSTRLSVPVVVVGNINVGGTGKTPLVIWLAEQLQLAGYRPGIISRGYGGSAQQAAEVMASSSPFEVGDEPVLIAMRTSCPVFVSASRVEAGLALLAAYPECNVIISDDGLQHYQLQRNVEIIVYDSVKGFGNGALLPAGPLRESKNRLKTVDAVVSNGSVVNDELMLAVKPIEMQLESTYFYNVLDDSIKSDAQAFIGKKMLAIAGIGNPLRFFNQLRCMGLDFKSQSYSDHYAFTAEDFRGIEAEVVVMTEKDAVKCRSIAGANFWVLPVSATIKSDLLKIVLNKLNKLRM